ncbi:MAG: DUF4258 domain-containing protein [Thermodesulfobacteriota bacterium]
MFERKISKKDVCHVLAHGQLIAEYPDDTPFPSFLVLGFPGQMPLHVVCAVDAGMCYIITAYIPAADQWSADYTTRR